VALTFRSAPWKYDKRADLKVSASFGCRPQGRRYIEAGEKGQIKILNYLSAMWAAMAPALGNHLWQSTLCLVMAGLLTLILRKNRAWVRYGLWLAASVKFLLPFSLLVTLGTHMARPRVLPPAGPGFFFAMEEVGQPFTPAARAISPVAHSTASVTLRLLPAILMAIWLVGFAVVLILWSARWRRISAAIREAVPLQEGREVEALCRAERLAGIRKPIELLLSPATLEPGIFGIVKPVLIWPQGISERLQDVHLEAILAHEVWHVRRRDNLAAAIQMVVEALFWFHPLVWWLGSRLVDERERACDEAVMEFGREPQVYAESILKTCEFCVESPLACVSGVTWADLKKRIVRIMTGRIVSELSFSRKLLLAAICITGIVGPVVFGLVNAPQIRAQSTETTGTPLPSFGVASINPDRSGRMSTRGIMPPGIFKADDATVKELVGYAFAVRAFQVSGGPGWIDSDRFDVEAKADDAQIEALRKLPPQQRAKEENLMLQALLVDRFNLKVTHTTQYLPVYALVVAKNGPKLHEAQAGDTYRNGIKGPDGRPAGPITAVRAVRGELIAQALPVALLASVLTQQLGRVVLDQTGLKGKYDFTLQWTPDENEDRMLRGPAGGNLGTETAPPPDTSRPAFFTAIQEQLGLKLESTKGPVDIVVIDHIERASEN
jgi:uncharacterized protein (TIGR03435 family)